MPKLRLRFVAALVALALVTSASVDDGPSGTGPLVLYDGQPNANDADWSGILTREGDCLYIDWYGVDAEGDDNPEGEPELRVLVAFPAVNTSWDDDEQAVKFGGETLRVGEHVEVGGSGAFEHHEGSAAFTAFEVPPDRSCDTSEIWKAG